MAVSLTTALPATVSSQPCFGEPGLFQRASPRWINVSRNERYSLVEKSLPLPVQVDSLRLRPLASPSAQPLSCSGWIGRSRICTRLWLVISRRSLGLSTVFTETWSGVQQALEVFHGRIPASQQDEPGDQLACSSGQSAKNNRVIHLS